MPTQDARRAAPPSAAAQPRATRRTYRVCYWSFSAFLVCAALGSGRQPPPSFAMPPASPRPMGETAVPPGAASPLDEPLRLIGEARKAFQEVQDYSGVLVKRERINGQLTAENVIALKVRNQPFSVYMHWTDPKEMAGQEVCYVAGKHGNKMRVRASGGLGLVGWVTLDQKDPRALRTSRHAVSEAGLRNLMDRYAAAWQAERLLGKTQVDIAEYEYNKRRCTRVEAAHAPNTVGQFEYFRTVVYFDKDSKLPVRVECYDYPRGADDPGELLEVYSYINLRFNVGLGDETFNH